MAFRDTLLNPIAGNNPGGISLRYDPIYDKIKEARREEDQPPPGMTEHDRKLADNAAVVKFTSELLATKSKDLQLAAWLTEALVKQNGFAGLRDGLEVCYGLVDKFWDTLHPELEDGDPQARGAPLGFIGTRLDIAVKLVPLVLKARYSFLDYQQSREVGYEDQVKSDDAKKKRAQLIKDGRLAPEVFDKAFEETPKTFYAQAEKDIDESLRTLSQLQEVCDAKFDEEGPSFIPLRSALEAIRHVIHALLQKKREKDPDPVQAAPSVDSAPAGATECASVNVVAPFESAGDTPTGLGVLAKVVEGATFLRRNDPTSPASYLLLRGWRWGELRAAAARSDPTWLEAPPTELRTRLKRLALTGKWSELLEAAESAMALPCSRAWLDLQHFVIEACQGLGGQYDAVAQAIRSELKALLSDFPQLLDATLMDDTPAANAETRAWLKAIMESASIAAVAGEPSINGNGFVLRWPEKTNDSYSAALQALREGQQRKAFEILQQDIARQRSGRERFRRRMQLVDICASTSKQNIAQPLLDDLAAAIENHKLDEWEDPGMVAQALSTILKLSQRIQADKAQQQKLFERICRLDPAQALGDGK